MLAASPCKKIRPELSAVVYFCGGLPSPHTPGSESRCASAPRKKGGSLSGAPPTLPIREAGGFPGGASCKVLHALRAAKRLTQNSFADHVHYTRMRHSIGVYETIRIRESRGTIYEREHWPRLNTSITTMRGRGRGRERSQPPRREPASGPLAPDLSTRVAHAAVSTGTRV